MNEILIILMILLLVIIILCIVGGTMRYKSQKKQEKENYEDDIPLYFDGGGILPQDAKPWEYNTYNVEQEMGEQMMKPSVMEEVYEKQPGYDMYDGEDEGESVEPYSKDDLDYAPVA